MAQAYSEKMVCYWSSWSVVAEFHLRLDLPLHNCTDMTGCIASAKGIMPDVARIETYSGGEPDTVYKLLATHDGKGEWKAFSTRRVGKRA